MAKKQNIRSKKLPAKKRFPLIPVLAGLFALGLVLAVGGFAFAAQMESNDGFCASCHTQPETTYFGRSSAETRVDLASFHQQKKTRCIDCHSGAGVTGRIGAELNGAHNALAFYTGTAEQPGVLYGQFPDENCLKCHQDVTSRNGRVKGGENGHWHIFLTRWQARDPGAATCVSCHAAHATEVTVAENYLNIPKTRSVCERCHNALGE
jgi:hypothetical protein